MTHLSRLCLYRLWWMLFVVLTGCGGGTSGTGVKSFEGVVRSLSGAPIENAQITIVQTGETATTNSDGQFEIRSRTEEPNVEVALSSPEVSDIVSVTELPPVSAVVSMDITVDSDKREVTAATIEVTPIRSDDDSDEDSGDDSESSSSADEMPVVGDDTLEDTLMPGGSALIQGRLVSPTGEPLSGVVVTIPGTGITTITDSEGNFVLDISSVSGSVGIEFSSDGLSTSVDLGDLPDDAEMVGVEVALNPADSTVSSVTVEVVNSSGDGQTDSDVIEGDIPVDDGAVDDGIVDGGGADEGETVPGDTGDSDGSDTLPPNPGSGEGESDPGLADGSEGDGTDGQVPDDSAEDETPGDETSPEMP